VKMDSYNPTNSPASCPSVGASWAAESTPLPPTPNKQLCQCMYDSLRCVVSSKTSENDYEDLFDYVCGADPKACAGIAANATTGKYGAYGMCDSEESLSFVLNQYYKSQGSSSDACNFKGAAGLKASKNDGGSCSALIQQAGVGGTGTVTSAPSGTGAVGGGSGSGSGGSAASSSGGASGLRTMPSSESGFFPMVFIVSLAALSGMGMMLL